MKDLSLAFLCLLTTLSPLTEVQAQSIQKNTTLISTDQNSDPQLDIIIKPGQSLSSILNDNGIESTPANIEAVQSLNRLDSTSTLIPGESIRIPQRLVLAEQSSRAAGPLLCDGEVCFKEADANEMPISTSTLEHTGTDITFSIKKTPVAPRPASTSAMSTTESAAASTHSATATDSAISDAQSDAGTSALPAEKSDNLQHANAVDESPKQEPSGNTSNTPLPQQPREENNEQSNSSERAADPPIKREDQETQSPGQFEVDEDAAVRALERSLVKINALLLDSREIETSLELSMSYDESRRPESIELTSDEGTINRIGEIEYLRSSYGTTFGIAFGLPGDSQIRLRLPVSRSTVESNILVSGTEVDGVSNNHTGLGDATLSISKTLSREKGRMPDVIASVIYDSDTGSLDNGVLLGDDQQSLGLSLRFTKRNDPLVFTGQVSRITPLENNDFKGGSTTGISVSALLAASPLTSMVFSFNHSIFDSSTLNNETIRGTKGVSSTISIEVSSAIATGTFLSAGVVTGLTDQSNDVTGFIGLSRRFRF